MVAKNLDLFHVYLLKGIIQLESSYMYIIIIINEKNKLQHTKIALRDYDSHNLCLFDSLCPSQQFFSYVGTGLPGLNQF